MSAATETPPVDIAAESAVLGTILLTAQALDRVIVDPRLTADDFYRPRHQLTFRAMVTLAGRDESVDAVTVSSELDRMGVLEEAGGEPYIHSLPTMVPSAGAVRDYARRVVELAGFRAKMAAARALVEAAAAQDQEGVQKATAALDTATAPTAASVPLTGSQFILDAPTEIPAVWGDGERILQAAEEPLMIVGPPGVGKTTLAQNLALRRHGIGESELLGLPIAVDPRPVMYAVADRPAQAARSFARMVGEDDREGLDSLIVHKGPFPCGDLARLADPTALASWLLGLGVGTLFIDSLKDFAVGLSEDTPAATVNQALQAVVTAGIQLVVLHHQRKASGDNKRPTSLADVYGSTWLTSGAGSVLLLWGEPGDAIVEGYHLKQPSEEVGPLKILHESHTGSVTLHEPTDLFALVMASGSGLSVKDAATALFGTTDPDANEIEKARRRLDTLVRQDKIGKADGGSPSAPVRYVPLELRRVA